MIVKRKNEELLNYLEDTSNLKGQAALLYIPQDKNEIRECIEECRAKKMPFTLSSGRTGTTGGCVPLSGAVVSLEGLNKIKDIDKNKKVAKVESGVSLETLEKQVNKFNLTLRASPTEPLAFLGGVVSTCASGVRGFGYGSIRNYLNELEVCLMDRQIINIKRGSIFSCGRSFDFQYKNKQFKFNLPLYRMPKVKSQAGYFAKDDMDFIDLFIGSEGTLGVITSCELSLQDVPFGVFEGIVFFSKEEFAFEFVNTIKLMKENRALAPACLEFFDANSLRFLKEAYSFIPASAAAVYFEQEAESEEEYETLIKKWQMLIEKSNASLDKSIFADTPGERKRLFEIRHKLPQMINESLRHYRQTKTAADIAVPWQKFKEMYEFYQQGAKESGLNYVNFGHIGEAHLHFNFLPENSAENITARKYLEVFCSKAVSLAGTVSAEHGIGKIKKPYLRIMYSQKEIEQMAALKKYFDPDCLLGLDNIFDKELLR